jgi:hypothetical protein
MVKTLSWLAIIATPCCKGSSVEAIYGLMRRCLERQMNPRDIVVSLIDVELINIQALLILTKRARKANCAQYRSVERFAPFKVTHAKVNMIYQSPLKVSHCYAVGKAVTDKQSGSTDSWPAVQRLSSAARQAGGKFANANLMTVWWVSCNDLLGRIRRKF